MKSNSIKAADKEALEIFEMLFNLGQTKAWYKSLAISSFWFEKLIILLRISQLFVFTFAANYETWPVRWRGMIHESGISIIFAADFGTLFYDDIMKDNFARIMYSSSWIIFASVVIAVYIFGRFIMPLSVLWRLRFERYYLEIAHLFYLPIALGLLPIAICRYDNCWDDLGAQATTSVISFIIMFLYLIGMPIYVILVARKNIITDDPEAHEDFIKQKEMEYVLQISHSWLSEKYYLFSSYRKTKFRIYHKSVYEFFVLSLVLVHGLLNTNQEVKMLVLTLQLFGFSIYLTIFPAYRCLSSSYLFAVGLWTICANMFLGYLKAAHYKAEALVDENMVSILVAVNVAALIILLFLMCAYFIFCLKWPVNLKTVKNLALGYRFLLADLRNAQKMILVLRSLSHYQFVKAEPVVAMIKLLRDHYYLLYNENHPLQYTVLEQLDILNYLQQRVSSQTLLPCKKLEENFGLVVRVMNRRWREQILMTPVKRRILLKLYILRMFIGNRIMKPFNSGEQNNYIGKGEKMRPIDVYDFDMDKLYQKLEKVLSDDVNEEKMNDITFIGGIDGDSLSLKGNIQKAHEENNIHWLVDLTENALNIGDEDSIEMLAEIWDERGIKNLPEDLRSRLKEYKL
ncbi:unnamed protein product [Blepharisma stoltei]|uniref:Uncharacterized protein n=1 Tax=Blepharisma stoltei TaxID=1481888 RepID=A0AAU9K759_9CILI|nr:unnamed protein product [Blepharisma stoltei]